MNVVFTPTAWEQYTEWRKRLSESMNSLRILTVMDRYPELENQSY